MNVTGVKPDTDRIPPEQRVSGVSRVGSATTSRMRRTPVFTADSANLAVSQTRTYLQTGAMIAAATNTAEAMAASAKFVEMAKNQIWLKPGASRAEQATQVNKVDVPRAPLAGHQILCKAGAMSVRALWLVLMVHALHVLTAKNRTKRRPAAEPARMRMLVWEVSAFVAKWALRLVKTGKNVTSVTQIRSAQQASDVSYVRQDCRLGATIENAHHVRLESTRST